MKLRAIGVDPLRYQPHPLHLGERDWVETNCYVDLWVEVLHALGLDPLAAASFTFATDFEGDQWTMFKFPPEDLWLLYGISVAELNVWRPLAEHLAEQLGYGRLLTVDVDAWHLPDTRGITYHTDHQKTTLAVEMIDLERSRMGYFHNASYYELEGEDFEGIVGGSAAGPLPPYVEVIRLDRLRPRSTPPLDEVLELTAKHLSRRPADNPMIRFRDRLESDLEWLVHQDMETFHRYAFGACRQCGATAELSASFVGWLDERVGGGLLDTAAEFQRISSLAKALQFSLARGMRGRAVDVTDQLDAMASAWETGMEQMVKRYG